MPGQARSRLSNLSLRLIKVNRQARRALKLYFWDMKQQRSTLILMLSSLLVLGCFLAFWLREAYQDAESALAEKGNLLYQEAVRQVQDSVYRQVIQIFVQKAETNGGFFSDSLPSGLGILDVQVRTDSTPDRLVTDRFPTKEKQRFRQLGLTITADTVKTPDTLIYIEKLERFEHLRINKRDEHLQGEIRKYFNNALQEDELPQTYSINQDSLNRDTSDLRFFPGDFNTFLSERVVFQQTTSFLLSKISGQLLFSVFLFCLTTLAFVALHRSNKRALQYTQLKSDFMSNMTHELKTPITTVGLALEAMQGFINQQQTDKAKEYLQISQHELNRLSLLVDKVLKLSVFENDIPKLKREPTDMKQLLRKVMDAMHIQIEQNGGHFQFSTKGNDFRLVADPIHLTNVVFNLLDNSIKYTETTPKVELQLKEADDHIELLITDNGMGIPREYREKVFDRFFRVPGVGSRHDVKGYGLGLSYVADIIKQHGGQISLSPNTPSGTRFTIILPKDYE